MEADDGVIRIAAAAAPAHNVHPLPAVHHHRLVGPRARHLWQAAPAEVGQVGRGAGRAEVEELHAGKVLIAGVVAARHHHPGPPPHLHQRAAVVPACGLQARARTPPRLGRVENLCARLVV